MNLKTFLGALHQAREIEKRKKAKDRLVGSKLNYTIIEDLVNAANYYGVVVSVGPLATGETIRIEPKPQMQGRTGVRQRVSMESDWMDEITKGLSELPGQGR